FKKGHSAKSGLFVSIAASSARRVSTAPQVSDSGQRFTGVDTVVSRLCLHLARNSLKRQCGSTPHAFGSERAMNQGKENAATNVTATGTTAYQFSPESTFSESVP